MGFSLREYLNSLGLDADTVQSIINRAYAVIQLDGSVSVRKLAAGLNVELK